MMNPAAAAQPPEKKWAGAVGVAAEWGARSFSPGRPLVHLLGFEA